MSDDDWETGYARAVGVFLNGDAIPTTDAYGGRIVDDSFLVLFNASERTCRTLPDGSGPDWVVELDTNLAAGHDVTADGAILPAAMVVVLGPRAVDADVRRAVGRRR